MPRKNKIETPHVMTREEKLNNFLNHGYGSYRPVPSYEFNIGDRVSIGALENVHVIEKLDNGIYEIEYSSTSSNYGKPITANGQKRFVYWYEIRPYKDIIQPSIEKNKDLRLSFSQQTLDGGILHRIYFAGVDFNPEYQRDYIWEQKDKELLIDSIFNNIDIGKFVFIHNEYYEKEKDLYECLDGQQRCKTLLEYFENRFPYQGYYFNDLSVRDQCHFENYSISVAEVREITKEQKLRYFLHLNRSGKSMDIKHLEKVENMLKEIERNGKNE